MLALTAVEIDEDNVAGARNHLSPSFLTFDYSRIVLTVGRASGPPVNLPRLENPTISPQSGRSSQSLFPGRTDDGINQSSSAQLIGETNICGHETENTRQESRVTCEHEVMSGSTAHDDSNYQLHEARDFLHRELKFQKTCHGRKPQSLNLQSKLSSTFPTLRIRLQWLYSLSSRLIKVPFPVDSHPKSSI
jgi:hypothetical protein